MGNRVKDLSATCQYRPQKNLSAESEGTGGVGVFVLLLRGTKPLRAESVYDYR